MRGLSPPGLATDPLQPIAIDNRLAPVLFLLQDVDQAGQRHFHVIGLVHQLLKQGLGPIEQASAQIILAQFQHGSAALIVGQVGSCDQATVDMDRPVHFTATTEQVPQSQVRFGGILIYIGHAGKNFDGLIWLVVDQVIQALEILGAAHGCIAPPRVVAPSHPPARGSGNGQQQPQQFHHGPAEQRRSLNAFPGLLS
jgi:hypothetical protein